MKQYQDYLRHILKNGVEKSDRTGTGTKSVFAYQMRFNLQEGFPLVTTKKIHTKSIFHELLWIISGNTNIKYLQDNGVTIWDEWADENGDLGPVYGAQWRKWNTYVEAGNEFYGAQKYQDGVPLDQLAEAIETLKKNPDSRRIIVSAWNPPEIPNMKLPPCHAFFQFYVADGKLSCQLYQRSCDSFLGVPFNIASYALLVHMIAHVTELEVGEFIWTGGDCHIYLNHIEQVKLQLSREPYPLPQLLIKRKVASIDDFKFDDFEIVGYESHPAIKAPVAV